jgi:uncharacterized protein (TIGR02117 family)
MIRRLGLVFLLAAGCATATSAPTTRAPAHTHSVFLVSHGWHVGLAVRRADVSPALWPESGALGPVRYVEVGWGDADYYPAAQAHPALALQAAFASAATVLHVAAIDRPLEEFFEGSTIIEVPLSSPGFEALTRFIHAAYARDASGQPIVVGAGIYGVSRFYRAEGRYRLFDNSNTWTAKALAAAGCPIDSADTVTAGSLLRWAHGQRATCR